MQKHLNQIAFSLVWIVVLAGCSPIESRKSDFAAPEVQQNSMIRDGSVTFNPFGKYSLVMPAGWYSDPLNEKSASRESIRTGDCPNRPEEMECYYDYIVFTLIPLEKCAVTGVQGRYADFLVSSVEKVNITPSTTALTWLLIGPEDGERQWCLVDSEQNSAIELRVQEADETTKVLVHDIVLPQLAAQLQKQ